MVKRTPQGRRRVGSQELKGREVAPLGVVVVESKRKRKKKKKEERERRNNKIISTAVVLLFFFSSCVLNKILHYEYEVSSK